MNALRGWTRSHPPKALQTPVPSCFKMPFPEQSTAASNIFTVFRKGKLRYAMLVAFCQAGKTGAYQDLIRMMLAEGNISQVYILCGSNETELRSQAHEDTKAANPAAYASGAIKVVFRQDFKDFTMNIANVLIVVDESHMDQTQGQELDRFLARHGLTMDGNPKTLNEKNAFIVSVDATPYSELAALKHEESFSKHVEMLAPGEKYFGLSDYFYADFVKPTFDITEDPQRFLSLLKDNKYGIMRLQNGEKASQQEMKAVEICTRNGGKVYYYTAEKTEIAITAAQKAMLNLKLCLDDMPNVPSLVIIRGRLRAGNVVPKKHVGFVWEGATFSKTDTLEQALPGRMCGYDFGEEKPLIFLPPSSLKRHEGKVVKASEIERAIMGFPVVLPMNATNLKKGHVANRATNGKTQCPPLRLTWDTEDDDWHFTEKFEEKYKHGDDRKDIQDKCYAVLLKNLDLIRHSPNYSSKQKDEILSSIVPYGARSAHIRNMQGDSQLAYFTQLREAYMAGTAPAEHIAEQDPLNFIVTYKGYKSPFANHRHFYVVFYTDASNGTSPNLMAVDIKSRIPVTNGKSVFSVHDTHVDKPLVAGGVVGLDETKLKSPLLLESALREYLYLYSISDLTVSRCIQSNKERFTLSKKDFHYMSSKQNDVEKLCGTLSREFGVKLKVSYTRSGEKHFNIKKIEW